MTACVLDHPTVIGNRPTLASFLADLTETIPLEHSLHAPPELNGSWSLFRPPPFPSILQEYPIVCLPDEDIPSLIYHLLFDTT